MVSGKFMHIAEIHHKHTALFLVDCDSICNFASSKKRIINH